MPKKSAIASDNDDNGNETPKYEIFKIDKNDITNLLKVNILSGILNPSLLDKIRVPAAAQTSFEIHSADGIHLTKEIRGIILLCKVPRRYWIKKYGDGEKTRPDCVSDDSIKGFGNRGVYGQGWQDCHTCELNKFGLDGSAKPCRQYISLYTLMPDELLPVVITAPPTSITGIEEYFYRLTRKFLVYNQVETVFRLEKEEVGKYTVAVLKLSLSPHRLDKEATERLGALANVIVPSLEKASLQLETTADDMGVDDTNEYGVPIDAMEYSEEDGIMPDDTHYEIDETIQKP